MKKTILLAGIFFFAFFMQTISATKITAVRKGSKIDVTINKKFFTSYIFSAEEKYPFFFPVNGPVSDGSVTSMRNADYPHHSSLFFACDRVNGGNYWQEGLNRGQILSKGAEIVESGNDRVLIVDECFWHRPGAESPVKDTRRIIITAPEEHLRQIDFEITVETLTAVEILKTNHSLFSGRIAVDLNMKNGGIMVDAQGNKGEKETFGKAAAWIDCYGKRGEVVEGIVIMQHPSNLGYPSPWFTRDYGFISPTPMYWPPNGADKINIPKGERITLRYRVLVHTGDHKAAAIAVQFDKYRNE